MKRLMIVAMMLGAIACGDDSGGDDDGSGEETPRDSGAGDANTVRDARADARADAGNSGGGDEDASEPVEEEDAGETPVEEDASVADAGRDAGAADAGGDSGTADAGACATLTYDAFGKAFLEKYCSSCHAASKMGSARMGAPANRIYDTLAQVKSGKALLQKEVVDDKSMPFGGALKPTNAERTQFGAWLACGPN
ncbi:MAG: hypothetical protein ABW352_16405 [Polyangiales bacterium]